MKEMTGSQRELLTELLPLARQRAAAIGPQHAWWDLISDAEALLAGRQTYLSLPPSDVAAKIIASWEQGLAGSK
ncbi:hypothetical protein [Bosea minatitlanensis]|uniref:Uncharacterized protein n=1 Tax=Bosea minatitlanensis TaxID=128782 RepID=A0ABW0F356_9HYPH|nr:hypothetical protein [Bosea minatitlanensis]MCT4492724.1 hypothetical protein [Bosea minatitlanensis]